MAGFYQAENEAESARYQGLANLYTNTQRVIEAEAARYTALANFYQAENGTETARYQGLADLYTNTQQAIKADDAPYTALVAFYPNEERFNSEFFAANPELMVAGRYLVKTNTALPANNRAWDRWFYPGH